jgi:hypothetical protein
MGRKKNSREKKRGISYSVRVEKINMIYDRYQATGLTNREIWHRYIYPVYGICERTFYNLLKASSRQGEALRIGEGPTLSGGSGDERV